MTPVVVEEAGGPLAVVSVVIMMTVGVVVIVTGTGTVMATVKTDTIDGMTDVKREVSVFQCCEFHLAMTLGIHCHTTPY